MVIVNSRKPDSLVGTTVRFLLLLFGECAIATEEPTFTASQKEGDFEVRHYPALVAAQVSATGTRDEASNAGFKLLAGYIFGGNTRKQSIAMTAPVIQSGVAGQSGAWTVRFIMPSAYTMDSLPTPQDSKVQLLPLPPARFAAVMFSGLAREAEVALRTAELQARPRWRATTRRGHRGSCAAMRFLFRLHPS